MTAVILLLSLYLFSGLLIFFISQYIRINFRSYFTASLIILTLFVIVSSIMPPVHRLFNSPQVSLILFLFFVFILSSAAVFARFFEKQGFGKGKSCIRKLCNRDVNKTFLLTFDDGPHAKYTPSIVKILDENNIKAVFFLVGKAVEENREIVKKLKESGMETAVHSFSHKPLPFLSTKHIEEEIGETVRIIRDITGSPPVFFRPPWGFYNREVLDVAEKHGLTTLLWSCSSRDWKENKVDKICRNVEKDLIPGVILLFHDGCKEGAGRECTVEALPLIIGELKGKGLSPANLSELCI